MTLLALFVGTATFLPCRTFLPQLDREQWNRGSHRLAPAFSQKALFFRHFACAPQPVNCSVSLHELWSDRGGRPCGVIDPGGCTSLKRQVSLASGWRIEQRHVNLGRKTRGLCLGAQSATSLRMSDGKYPVGWDEVNFQQRRRKIFSRKDGRFGLQSLLVCLNVVSFLWQVWSALWYVPTLNSILSRTGRLTTISRKEVMEGIVWGSSPLVVMGKSRNVPQPIVASSAGPFTMDFVHQPAISMYQPHRFLTGGFLHGNLVHLVLNMRYLWMIPSWLEVGLGRSLYLTAYLVSIVTGNIAHSMVVEGRQKATLGLCLGSSAGICGLNGLMYVLLRRMGNKNASQAVFRGMTFLIFYGLIAEGISNVGHIGGFLGGAAVGYVFGPQYGKSYSLRKKFSLEVDQAPNDYRRAMGFGIQPTKGILPLSFLWAGAFLALLVDPNLRTIPSCIVRGLFKPGSLSGILMN